MRNLERLNCMLLRRLLYLRHLTSDQKVSVSPAETFVYGSYLTNASSGWWITNSLWNKHVLCCLKDDDAWSQPLFYFAAPSWDEITTNKNAPKLQSSRIRTFSSSNFSCKLSHVSLLAEQSALERSFSIFTHGWGSSSTAGLMCDTDPSDPWFCTI